MNNNPVLVILNGLATVAALVLVALNALKVTHLDPAAMAAVVAAVAGVCNLVGLAIRAAVVPVGVHAEQVAQALATPPPGTPGPTVFAEVLDSAPPGGTDRAFTWTGPVSPGAAMAEAVKVAQSHADRKAAGA